MLNPQNIIQKLLAVGIKRFDSKKVIYKYMSVDDAKKVLGDRTLMFQKPLEFNDPFELHLGLLDCKPKDGTEIELFEKYFAKGTIPDDVKESLTKNGNGLLQKCFEDALAGYRNNIGITCFTEDPVNTLMWSHYAKAHKGICIGFIKEEWDRVTDTFHVNYSQSINPINFFDEDKNEISFWYWVFTKSHIWSYEKEIRCVNMFKNGIMPLGDIIVNEIFYGAGTLREEMKDIEALLQYHPITKKVKMEINPKTFDLIATPA